MESNTHIQAPQPPRLAVVLPHDEDAEKALLATLLTYKNDFAQVRDFIHPADFYMVKHQKILACIEAVAADGDEISMVSVAQKAMAIFPTDLQSYDIASICDFRGGGEDVAYLANIVVSLAKRREAYATFTRLAENALAMGEDLTETMEQGRKSIDNIQSVGKDHILDLDAMLNDLTDVVVANQSPISRQHGTPTGFESLDAKGGLQPSDLIVIAAESSQGKTSFAMSICLNAVLNGESVAYYSLEMSSRQLCARLVSMRSGVSSNRIVTDCLSDEELRAVAGNSDAMRPSVHGGNLFIDDRPTSSLSNILASIRSMAIKRGIRGVVVDFLQRLRPDRGMSKEQFIGEAAQRLKDLARELDIWVIALSQLSRDRENPEPTVNRLRDSGQINEAADVTILLYRPEAIVPYSSTRKFPEPFQDKDTAGMAMVTIAKGRNIGTGSFLCGFDAQTTRFFPKSPLDLNTAAFQRNAGYPF